MRRALVVSVAILVGLGLDLVVLPEDTARFWPIEPAVTASVFAGFYLAATPILVLALRGWIWATVRVVLPGGIGLLRPRDDRDVPALRPVQPGQSVRLRARSPGCGSSPT
jgi:hypothetical protein